MQVRIPTASWESTTDTLLTNPWSEPWPADIFGGFLQRCRFSPNLSASHLFGGCGSVSHLGVGWPHSAGFAHFLEKDFFGIDNADGMPPPTVATPALTSRQRAVSSEPVACGGPDATPLASRGSGPAGYQY